MHIHGFDIILATFQSYGHRRAVPRFYVAPDFVRDPNGTARTDFRSPPQGGSYSLRVGEPPPPQNPTKTGNFESRYLHQFEPEFDVN